MRHTYRQWVRVKRTSSIVALAAANLVSSTAFAQAADDTPNTDEIVVTAEKRESRLVDTPISITALSASRLASSGITNFIEIASLVPGLRMDQLGANTQPTLRGISSGTAGVGSSTNVATYIDGFYIASQSSSGFDLPGISNIQVLKGPQGTLFGRNATGGAILVTTLRPSSEPAGQFSVGYGTYDEKLINGRVTGGLTDTLAASITAYYRDTDGWTRNILTGKKDGIFKSFAVSGKLLYQPSTDVSVLLEYKHQDTNDPYGQVYRIVGPNSLPNLIPGAVVTDKWYRTAESVAPKNHTVGDSVYLTAQADVGFAKISSYTGYLREKNTQKVDFDGSSLAFYDLGFAQNTKTFSQELNVASKGDGPLSWVAGLYYFYDNGIQPYLFFNPSGPNPPSFARNRVKTNAYAAFADATYKFFDSWYLTAGFRYSIERKDIDNYVAPLIEDYKTWKSGTPRVVLRHELNRFSNVYASWSRGFKSGTFNGGSPADPPARPEKVDAFEGGYKYSRGGLSIEAAGFYYNYRDLQVSSYSVGQGNSLTTLQNAAKAEIYGAELAINGKVTDALTLHASGGYTHGQYKSYPGAVSFEPDFVNGGYLNVPVDAGGNQMLRTPRLTGNLGADYQVPFATGQLSFSTNLYLTSRIYFDAANQFSQKGYGLLDLSAKWTSGDGRYDVMVSGRNITDTHYINYYDPLGVSIMVNDGRPATGRITFSYRM